MKPLISNLLYLDPMNDMKQRPTKLSHFRADLQCKALAFEEVYASELLKRYSRRLAKLENVTLADWAAG